MADLGRKPAGARDLTSGPIGRTLLLFALPTLGSNVLQSLNGSINAIWVGQYLGETGLAATSNANLIMFVMFALVFGFGMASTIIIGQSMGRHDIAGVRRAVGAGFGLFLLIGISVALLGWLATPTLLRMLGTPADVYPQAFAYLRVMFVGLPPSLLTIYLAMALRGTGDSLTPLLLMIPGALVDVALNPVFILGLGPAPRMGIAGSAMATLIANYTSLLLLLANIYLRDLPIRLRGAELRHLFPARDLLATIVRKGVPMGLQMIVASGSALVMIGLVNRQGTSTVAAYGAANQLWTYIQMPALAIGAAVSGMAAQNIGAGRWDRIGRIARAGVVTNLLMTGMLVVLVTVLDRYVLGLFLGGDGGAIAIAQRINLLASWSFILFGVMIVLSGVTRANGATIAPLVIMILALVPGRIGAAYALEPLLGPDALWWSFPVGAGVAMLLTIAYYLHGGWRRLKPLAAEPVEEAEEFAHCESEPAGRIHPTA